MRRVTQTRVARHRDVAGPRHAGAVRSSAAEARALLRCGTMHALASVTPLRRSAVPRDLLAAALEDLPDGVAVIEGEEDHIVAVNRAVRQLLGYEPSWLTGRPLGLLRQPGLPSVAARAWRHGLVVEDCELRRVDGSRCGCSCGPVRRPCRAASSCW